ncbi:hypothetical protein BRC77_06420 [Halobacteriales archaeon QH_8_64_26]|nr:MAG: hypothetical protein BRC77_06420 [Halobacteriales archaeon QH_8_64_26]
MCRGSKDAERLSSSRNGEPFRTISLTETASESEALAASHSLTAFARGNASPFQSHPAGWLAKRRGWVEGTAGATLAG